METMRPPQNHQPMWMPIPIMPRAAAESENRNQVSFGMSLPLILPYLDKARAMQLSALYTKLRNKEINKDEFFRHLKNIVGGQILRQALLQQQQQAKTQPPQNSQTSPLPVPVVRPHVPSGPEINIDTPLKNPSIGQKKPLDAPSIPANKKQKVSGAAFRDQSIKQLNGVTAITGVDLRQEQEQLLNLSGRRKEETRASEATRRVVQEEEERLILQRIPLQKKLAETTSKCGIEHVREDVERCISLCLEERMRGMIRNLITLSKWRVRSISVKDVIAVLEREPQMSKSALIYCLYERMRADAPTAE